MVIRTTPMSFVRFAPSTSGRRAVLCARCVRRSACGIVPVGGYAPARRTCPIDPGEVSTLAPGSARIVIAERWSVLRRGLSGLLGGIHQVVEQVDDPRLAAKVAEARPIDLAIVGDEDGLDLDALVGALGAVPVPGIVLTDDIAVDRLRGVLQAGARAVLSKKVEDAELLDAIDRVLGGDRVIDQRFLPLLFGGTELDADEEATGDHLLTPRERDVLALLARGCTNRQIASALLLGESTVKTYLGRIYGKLEVDDRHHAVGRAVELGLLR